MSLTDYNPSAFITSDQIVILDTTNASATNASLYVQGGLSTHDTFVDGHVMINNVKITPNLNDIIFEQESVLSNNANEWTTIPDFEFDSSITRTFKAHINITVSTGVPKYAYWEINGLFKSPGGWVMTSSFTGDLTGVNFQVLTEDSFGKIQYKNSNSSGTTTIRYRATTNAPPGTTPLGAASGIIENLTGPFTANRFVYANTNKTLASTDITYNANQFIIGGTSRLLLENASAFEDFSAGGSFTSMGDASVAQKLIVGQMIGIGTTSPQYTLDVSGDLNFSGNLYQNGTVFSSGTGGNVSSEWVSGTGGNLSYTRGNVGIGTTSPQYTLDIKPSSVFTAMRVNGAVEVHNSNGTVVNMSPNNGAFGSIEAFTTGNTAKLPLCLNAYGGNVGIGTTSPSQVLDILTNSDQELGIALTNSNTGGNSRINFNMFVGYNTSGNAGQIYASTSDPTFTIRTYSANTSGISLLTGGAAPIKFNIQNTERMRITTSGNIGIGTTSPQYTLDVDGSLHVNGLYSNYTNSTTGYLQIARGWGSNPGFIEFLQANGTRKGYIGYGGDTVAFQLIGEGSRSIELATNNVIQMTMTSSGNIGMGTTTPSVRLQVMNNGGGQSTARIYASGNAIYTDWPSGWGGGLNTYDISCAGIYYSTLSQRSDVRKKDNITTYTRGLSEVVQLRPVSFNWKEYNTSKIEYGFIAQEVEQILPEIVDQDSEGYKNIKNAYVPILVNAIRELNDKLDRITERLQTLGISLD